MTMPSAHKTAIVVFARVGEAEAKSLASEPERRARLSELLLRQTLETVSRVPAEVGVVLALEGRVPTRWLEPIRHRRPLHVVPQRGAGFEARLLGALEHARGLGYARLVVVGTDTPTMSPRDLHAACRSSRIVLGPSVDGGFYMLGLGAEQLEALWGLPWCTDRLLGALRERFSGLELDLRPLRLDLDRRAGLALMAHPLRQLALRLLGRRLDESSDPELPVVSSEPRSWRVETRLAPRGPPAAAPQRS